MSNYYIQKWDKYLNLEVGSQSRRKSVEAKVIVIRSMVPETLPVAMLLLYESGRVDLRVFRNHKSFATGMKMMTGFKLSSLQELECYSSRKADRGQINKLLEMPIIKKHAARIKTEVLGGSGSFRNFINQAEFAQRQKDKEEMKRMMGRNADAVLLPEDDYYAKDGQLGMF